MHIYTNDGVIIANVMRQHLNTWPSRPVDFRLEDFGKKTPSLMIQQLAASEKERQYIDGSYIGVWNFAICLRIDAEDTRSRLDAVSCLQELGEWLTAIDSSGDFVNFPEIDVTRSVTSIEVNTTPSIMARYEDGTEDYQSIFTMKYKARRK